MSAFSHFHLMYISTYCFFMKQQKHHHKTEVFMKFRFICERIIIHDFYLPFCCYCNRKFQKIAIRCMHVQVVCDEKWFKLMQLKNYIQVSFAVFFLLPNSKFSSLHFSLSVFFFWLSKFEKASRKKALNQGKEIKRSVMNTWAD